MDGDMRDTHKNLKRTTNMADIGIDGRITLKLT
jgi:hypothetical protein